MFLKKQLCPNCKRGMESYEIDNRSENCPYMGSLRNGKCPFYVPFEKKNRFWPFWKKN